MEEQKELITKLYLDENKTMRQVAEIIGTKRKTIEYWLGKWKINKIGKHNILPNRISLKNPEFCYFLGLWIADGWINSRENTIAICLKDNYILDIVANYLNPDLKIRTYRKANEIAPLYQLHIGKDENFIRFLKEHNLSSARKTFTAVLPFIEDKICAKMLIRGFIDGDGNIRDGAFRIFTASPDVRDTLCKLIEFHYDYKLTVSPTKTKKSGGFTLSSRMDFLDSLIDIYQDFEEFCIERKKANLKSKVYDIVRSHKMINYGSWGLTP